MTDPAGRASPAPNRVPAGRRMSVTIDDVEPSVVEPVATTEKPPAAESGSAAPLRARSVFSQARRHLAPGLALAGRMTGSDAVEVRAQDCRVELSDGRVVLDFGSYGVTLLGHRPPAVVAAVRRQLDVMPAATRVLVNPWTAAAAAKLADYMGGGLSRVYFGANGADAVEAATKFARLARRRRRIVAVEGGFHGKSLGALALTHHERYRAGLADVLPPVVHVPPDDPDAVTRELQRGDVAAVVFEPVQSENGVRPLDTSVMRAWCTAAARYGVFVIADEIQTGLRRCGERSIALAAGLPVDAVLLGKSLGGGVLPISAVVCNERLYAPLAADPVVHTATFAGHPLACAAVPAVLDGIEELAGRGTALAAAMRSGLAKLAHEHAGLVRSVRGRGLLWAFDLVSENLAGKLVVQLAQGGLLLSPCMSSSVTLRLLPPLTASDADIDEALSIIDSALTRVAATSDVTA